MTDVSTVHRMKVSLRHVKPPVWRRVEVPSSMRLSELALVLEAAFGWLGYHLHAFEAKRVWYEPPSDDNFGFRETIDERTVTLAQVLPSVGSSMRACRRSRCSSGLMCSMNFSSTVPVSDSIRSKSLICRNRCCVASGDNVPSTTGTNTSS